MPQRINTCSSVRHSVNWQGIAMFWHVNTPDLAPSTSPNLTWGVSSRLERSLRGVVGAEGMGGVGGPRGVGGLSLGRGVGGGVAGLGGTGGWLLLLLLLRLAAEMVAQWTAASKAPAPFSLISCPAGRPGRVGVVQVGVRAERCMPASAGHLITAEQHLAVFSS